PYTTLFRSHGGADGDIVVDDFHGGLRGIDAAVGAVGDIFIAAIDGAPGGVVEAVAQVEAYPVLDEDIVVRAGEPGVGGVGLDLIVAGGGIVDALEAGNHIGMNQDLAVLIVGHLLGLEIHLHVGVGDLEGLSVVDAVVVAETGQGV